jgi:hypothetical protein
MAEDNRDTTLVKLADYPMPHDSRTCRESHHSNARKRPVDPENLVLVATAEGKLGSHGLGRLMSTPTTNMLDGLACCDPAHCLRRYWNPWHRYQL